MAVQTNPETISLATVASLMAVFYRFVRRAPGAAGVVLCPGAVKADAVMTHATSTTVCQAISGAGLVKITAGAIIPNGAQLASDAQGRAVPSTLYAGEEILGKSQQAAAAVGEIITMHYYGPAGAGLDRPTL